MELRAISAHEAMRSCCGRYSFLFDDGSQYADQDFGGGSEEST